jgi:CHAT domain-containing protein
MNLVHAQSLDECLEQKERVGVHLLEKKSTVKGFSIVYAVRMIRRVLLHKQLLTSTDQFLDQALEAVSLSKALYIATVRNHDGTGSSTFDEIIDFLCSLQQNERRIPRFLAEDLKNRTLDLTKVGSEIVRLALPSTVEQWLQLFGAGDYETVVNSITEASPTRFAFGTSAFELLEKQAIYQQLGFNIATLVWISTVRATRETDHDSLISGARQVLFGDQNLSPWEQTILRLLFHDDESDLFLTLHKIIKNDLDIVHLCQAFYYGGVKLLHQGDMKYAKRLLKLSRDTRAPCIEFAMAEYDYKRCSSFGKNAAFLKTEYEIRQQENSINKDLSLQRLNVARAVAYCKFVRAAVGMNHPYHAQAQTYLGRVFSHQRSFHKAMRAHKLALRIRRKALGPTHMLTAQSLHNLGSVSRLLLLNKPGWAWRRQRLKNDAEGYLTTALKIRQLVLSKCNEDYLHTLAALAEHHLMHRNREVAERMILEATDIVPHVSDRSFAEDDSGYRFQLALVCLNLGKADLAKDLLRDWVVGDDKLLPWVFANTSEIERQIALGRMRWRIEAYLCLVLDYFSSSKDVVKDCFDLCLRRKGLTAEALRRNLTSHKTKEQESLVREIRSIRLQIGNWTRLALKSRSRKAHEKRLKKLNYQLIDRERTLAALVSDLLVTNPVNSPNISSVSETLQGGTTLIEFFRCPVFGRIGEYVTVDLSPATYRYAAFVIHSDGSEPSLIDFGDGWMIDTQIMSLRFGITGETQFVSYPHAREPHDFWFSLPKGKNSQLDVSKEYRDAGEQLREALLEPLRKDISGSTHLVISPDALMWKLPFEAIPIGDDKHLIDSHTITYVGAAREVVKPSETDEMISNPPIVIADPDFDMIGNVAPTNQSTELPTFLEKLFLRSRPDLVDVDLRTNAVRELRQLKIHFPRLTGTRSEGVTIASILGVKPWMGEDASADRLMKVNSPVILHIATHGIYLDRWLSKNLPTTLGIRPSLCSGLVLAGANREAKPNEEAWGFLTAEDILDLDLSGTELVVLSACETGLGDVHLTEGVLGLRRAFWIAGARSIIVSLWKVPDEKTKEFMILFYNRLISGESRAEAMRQTKLISKSRGDPPKVWTAFVCYGASGPVYR